MMFLIVALIAIVVALVTALCLPKLTKIAEKNVEDSYHELSNNPIRIERSWWLSIIIIALPCSVFFLITGDPFKTACITTLGVISYIDIKRNWVPDILIYLLTLLTFIYFIDAPVIGKDIYTILISMFIFTCPLTAMNIIGLFTTKKTFIASGDFYIAVPLALWMDITMLFYVSSLSILTALSFGVLRKKEHLPFIPFLYTFSFIEILLNSLP